MSGIQLHLIHWNNLLVLFLCQGTKKIVCIHNLNNSFMECQSIRHLEMSIHTLIYKTIYYGKTHMSSFFSLHISWINDDLIHKSNSFAIMERFYIVCEFFCNEFVSLLGNSYLLVKVILCNYFIANLTKLGC